MTRSVKPIKLKSRGEKYYAVMAFKEGWKKPRFVWTGYTQLYIYNKRKYATRQARELRASKDTVFAPQGTEDKCEKWLDVKWIVVPVWVETMVD